MRKAMLVVSAVALIMLAAGPVVISRTGLLINHSDSIRPVFLLRTSDANAPYIAFCAPASADDAVLKSATEGMPHGECRNGMMPLLKPYIVASPEHPLTLLDGGFHDDLVVYANTAVKEVSRRGVPLQHYPYGVYRSGIWPVSTESLDSYDARYFGPITSADILYRARPLFQSR